MDILKNQADRLSIIFLSPILFIVSLVLALVFF